MIGRIIGPAQRRPRFFLLAALVAVTALAWVFLLMGGNMPAMPDMPGMVMRLGDWSPGYAATVFVMWAVMMVAMMLPSAAPVILIYERMPGAGALRAGFLAAGYLAVWTSFSALATLAQWRLDSALMLMMDLSLPRRLGGALLVAAGLYQWSPFKQACLAACRNPVSFLLRHTRPGHWGAFRTGVAHGLFCLGCCWAMMLLLFVGGVMNLIWIAVLFALVLAEKFLPRRGASAAIGIALLLAGALMLVQPAGLTILR